MIAVVLLVLVGALSLLAAGAAALERDWLTVLGGIACAVVCVVFAAGTMLLLQAGAEHDCRAKVKRQNVERRADGRRPIDADARCEDVQP